MPIYEYRRPDGTTFEVIQKFSDDPLTKDPETGVPVERVLHAPAIHFKGKGFHNTDYGTKRRNRELEKSAESGADKTESKSADKKPESKGSGSSDSKPASDKKAKKAA
jgi:putative FmdB family regulatory protein